MLVIDNLQVCVKMEEGKGRHILKGVSLEVPAGQVHAIMGPNGCGKSTLSYLLSGREGYEIIGGSMMFEGQDLAGMEPEDRAAAGMFLSFQYPVEIPGVPILTFVKEALNAQRRARGEDETSTPQFMKLAREAAAQLDITHEMLKRPVNVDFSGGEKKRMEIFQALMLQPKFLILDETDSGLDIDALKMVAEGVNTLRGKERGMLVITHYQRLLDYLKPDVVHVMAAGCIRETGGPELALKLEEAGYDKYAGGGA